MQIYIKVEYGLQVKAIQLFFLIVALPVGKSWQINSVCLLLALRSEDVWNLPHLLYSQLITKCSGSRICLLSIAIVGNS